MFAFVALVVACTSNPSAKDIVQEVSPAVCKREQACDPHMFLLIYSGDTDESRVASCVDAAVRKVGDDGAGACSADEVNRCKADIEAAPCESFPAATGAVTLPDSCKGC